MKNGVLIFFICLTLLVFCPIGLAAEKIYHLGSGDVIEISVWKDPELSRNLVVPPDGIISFPLIGSIDVTHLTVSELKKSRHSKTIGIHPGCHGHDYAYRNK